MRPIERVAIVGAGAVGSSHAERLHALDPERVALVARGERLLRLRREGLTVNGRTFAVRCVGPGEGAPPTDLLLVAVKRHQLEDAIETAREVVGPETIVLPVLNGIGAEGVLAAAFGAERVLHGFVLGNDVVREGTRSRYTRLGRLVFGAASNDRADPRVLRVAELLDRAGIPHEVPEDVHRAQWWKFMLNVGVNQVSAVLRAPYGAFLAVDEVAGLMRRASLEAVAVARAEGVRLAPEDVDGVLPILATLAPGGKTSMLQDVEAGRRTEVDAFAGAVVALGARHGVETPVNAVLLEELRALERLAGAVP